MSVVLAEDDVDIRDLVQIVLEGLDLEVRAVGNGADALEECRVAPPRLLLLDITMPVMNGLEVCRAVRADPVLRDLPIILMTARAQSSDVAAGLDAGADAYIIKPFGPIELREHVEAVLSGRSPVDGRDDDGDDDEPGEDVDESGEDAAEEAAE